MAFSRTAVKTDVEQQLLIAMILNDSVCSQLQELVTKEMFSTKWLGIVYQWVSEYFSLYEKAPQEKIRDLYMQEVGYGKNRLSDTDSEAIELVLQHLSAMSDDEMNISNPEFYINRGASWAQKRSLELLNEEMALLLTSGQYDAAEGRILDFRKQELVQNNVFTFSDFIDVMAESAMEDESPIVEFPGALGQFIGPLQRTWLNFFMAPPKVGKSNFLVQATKAALLNEKNKIIVFSHEMAAKEWSKRFASHMLPGPDLPGTYAVPYFDCAHNATNDCPVAHHREGIGPYMMGDIFNKDYCPCTVCRYTNRELFQPLVVHMEQTYTEEEKDLFHTIYWEDRMRKMAAISKVWGDRFRFVAYPLGSAGVDEMKRELDRQAAKGFVADVVIDDYIGAHGKAKSNMDDREHFNYQAMGLKNIAAERICVVISAYQGNRGSIDKRTITQSDTAEDIRLVNHADKIITLNQTVTEKKAGIIRVGKAADRHMDWNAEDVCTCLNFSSGLWFNKDTILGSVMSYADKLALARKKERKDSKEAKNEDK